MMQNKIEKTGDWFVDQLSLYQNANSDNASVKRNFVVRKSEFELIMSDIGRKKPNDPLQHELLLGRRGSGKSTLLKRIQIEINEDIELNQKYFAINLAEEQAGIYRLSDLWFETLKELSIQTNQNIDLEAFSTFKDNHEYTRYLYDEIHKILKKPNKKVILLLDNIDRIVENFDDDGHLLRETLLNYNDVQIIGGSTRMDEHFWQYDKPFYEFFRRHRLVGLTFEEIDMLLNQWSVAMDLPLLKDYAKKNKGKIEALRILTDGLPRTLQFFIQILLQDATLYGFDYIKKVMDKASPLYQERLNNLTAPQRKIVLEMAFIWEACSTKQLVEVCRMEGKLISSFLKQLNSFGIVETIQTDTKNHLYRLSERFFNMWLIITQGNPDQKRKAKWLTIFLETWYNGNEIQDLAINHLKNIKTKKYTFDQAVVLTKAISQSKYIGVDDRDNLIDSTNMLKEPSTHYNSLPDKFEVIISKINELQTRGKIAETLTAIDQIENEEDGVKFRFKGYSYYLLNNYQEAIKYYLMSIEKGNIEALNEIGVLYQENRNYLEAEKYFLLGIEKKSIFSCFNLGVIYFEQGKLKEAEKYYLIAIDNGDILSINNLALIYEKQNKVKEAEKYYLLAIKKGDSNALHNLSKQYFLTKTKSQKALKFIEEKNKIRPNLRSKFLQIVIEIWNGKFENINMRIKEIFNGMTSEYLGIFLYYLLWLEQNNLVLSLFEDKEIGDILKEKYNPYFYTTMILNNKTENNLLLRIPPDVLPTVEEMVSEVKAKQKFYSE